MFVLEIFCLVFNDISALEYEAFVVWVLQTPVIKAKIIHGNTLDQLLKAKNKRGFFWLVFDSLRRSLAHEVWVEFIEFLKLQTAL